MEFSNRRPIIQQINYVNNYNNITTPSAKAYQNNGAVSANHLRALRPMHFMPNQPKKSSRNSDFDSFISVNSQNMKSFQSSEQNSKHFPSMNSSNSDSKMKEKKVFTQQPYENSFSLQHKPRSHGMNSVKNSAGNSQEQSGSQQSLLKF